MTSMSKKAVPFAKFESEALYDSVDLDTEKGHKNAITPKVDKPFSPTTLLPPTQEKGSKSGNVIKVVLNEESSPPKKTNRSLSTSAFFCLLRNAGPKSLASCGCYAILATFGFSFFFTKNRTNHLARMQLTPVLNDFETQVGVLLTQNNLLNQEIDRLDAQVQNLTSEIDNLGEENDLYANLNIQLQTNLTKLDKMVDSLSGEVEAYGALNSDLDENVQRLNASLEGLRAENGKTEHLNNRLQVQVGSLNKTVASLEDRNDNLTAITKQMADIQESMSTEIYELEHMVYVLDGTVSNLTETIVDLTEQNKRYRTNNRNLASLISFLNYTTAGLDSSLDETVDFLDDLIDQYRMLVLRDLEIQYQLLLDSWRCDLLIAFPTLDDPMLPLGIYYPMVLRYMNLITLSKMCGDLSDFESFLLNDSVTGVIFAEGSMVSLQQLSEAMELYGAEMHDFYFPDGPDAPANAIQTTEWEKAKFRCDRLPEDRRYRHFAF